MQYEIKNRWNGQSILKADAESFKDFVVLAVKRSANLSGADLSGANLSGADLSGANLSGADLRSADLRSADLRSADLRSAYLSGADLRSANLSGADLSGADLRSANLRSANLSGANLRSANLSGANLSGAKEIPVLASCELSIVPEQGQFIGWKKCKNNVIVKVLIGRNAKRSNATGRKCRAEYVKVLEVSGAEVGISQHDNPTEYRAGKIVRCDKWNDDRWTACGGGIHFFLTRAEAENY
jgi:hypothetical protein